MKLHEQYILELARLIGFVGLALTVLTTLAGWHAWAFYFGICTSTLFAGWLHLHDGA